MALPTYECCICYEDRVAVSLCNSNVPHATCTECYMRQSYHLPFGKELTCPQCRVELNKNTMTKTWDVHPKLRCDEDWAIRQWMDRPNFQAFHWLDLPSHQQPIFRFGPEPLQENVVYASHPSDTEHPMLPEWRAAQFQEHLGFSFGTDAPTVMRGMMVAMEGHLDALRQRELRLEGLRLRRELRRQDRQRRENERLAEEAERERRLGIMTSFYRVDELPADQVFHQIERDWYELRYRRSVDQFMQSFEEAYAPGHFTHVRSEDYIYTLKHLRGECEPPDTLAFRNPHDGHYYEYVTSIHWGYYGRMRALGVIPENYYGWILHPFVHFYEPADHLANDDEE